MTDNEKSDAAGRSEGEDDTGRSGRSESDRRSGGMRDWLDALREVAPYLDLGWRLAGTAAFPPIIGFFLDRWLGTEPWGVLVGSGVGLVGAFVQLKRLQEELDR